MKLLSRKALISVATATAIAAGSLSTPAFADTANGGSGSGQNQQVKTPSNDGSSGSSDESGSKFDIENVKKWVAVVSSIIGLITTILTFAGRLDKFFK
ncbi:hypothetical protein [Corynebacterium ulcerans]|uniref:hypothetical protein n=1 Tax=Corynebacterium ulcerans TaxID=65058 RepID=UPI00021416FE|nr:hypothetical protein [Corynebacterium ulcerans]AEG83988.1 putative secreted protein [Corynebacterium ulcerans BR-AD22]NOL58421.1 hypothetical protein [Corynebacterium ulcerans]NOM03053.1 hypothetical protein [Corynebacterium ulcerans]